MNPALHFGIGGALAALAVFAGWRGARPPNPMKGPRMIPWRAIMVFAAAFALIFLFTAAQEFGLRPPPRR